MLGIVGYFGGYYLFLPLVGIALIVGECFGSIHSIVSRFNPRIATAAVCAALLPFIIAARINAQSALYTNSALGYAGRIAEKSIRDLMRLHPTIPTGSRPMLGSSKMTSSGSPRRDWAIPIRCCIPLLKVPTLSRDRSARPTSSSISAIRARRSADGTPASWQ